MDSKKSKKQQNTSSNSRKQTSKKAKDAKVDKQIKDPSAGMRLNKYIANSGICSRRDADIYISAGNVTVNGKVITEMGYKVKLEDEVKFDGRRINPEPKEYWLLNKPKSVYTTGSYDNNNMTVLDLASKVTKAEVKPVGKLDTSALGLILLTNDGTLAKKLANLKHGIRQIYDVELNKNLDHPHLQQIKDGIMIEGFPVKIEDVSYVSNKTKKNIGIELKSQRPHIVQKIFKKLGYEIVKLDRVVYGGLTKKDLPRGRMRQLTKQEIINLGLL
ncbi:pseudouridine synthase [Psychroflexus aestuariivivens]|uniref:pseudouridine synthase n=1 Tax=Psychroflexus aestuariivivens TaxID=1795040 RepID=UPI000FDA11F6|nr:S4 domain-containing protein [Psychroflexus aestuariivivens]